MTSVASLAFLSLATLGISTQVLLITQEAHSEVPSCLARAFLGSYGSNISDRHNVYRCPIECTTNAQLCDTFAAASIIPIEENSRIVYLQEAGVEKSVRFDQGTFADELDKLMARIINSASTPINPPLHQGILSPTTESKVLHQTPTSALISVPDAFLPEIDTYLPRLFVPVVLPTTPSHFLPVPTGAVKRVSDLLKTLSFNADVASIVNNLSVRAPFLTFFFTSPPSPGPPDAQ